MDESTLSFIRKFQIPLLVLAATFFGAIAFAVTFSILSPKHAKSNKKPAQINGTAPSAAPHLSADEISALRQTSQDILSSNTGISEPGSIAFIPFPPRTTPTGSPSPNAAIPVSATPSSTSNTLPPPANLVVDQRGISISKPSDLGALMQMIEEYNRSDRPAPRKPSPPAKP